MSYFNEVTVINPAGVDAVNIANSNDEPIIVSVSDNATDAFGRVRVASSDNRFDNEFTNGINTELIDQVIVGSGTATFDTNSRDVALTIGGTGNTDEVSLYSHYDIPYTAGNSQLIELTGTLNNTNLAGGGTFVFLRSKVSGSVVTTTIVQNTWINNQVNDVDWAFSQIFKIDFQSLRVGRVRYSLIRNGMEIKLHEIDSDNVRNTGYWQTPNLPAYWRIYNDATYTYTEIGYGDTENGVGFMFRVAKNATASMRAICGTVKSEGGLKLFDLPGFERSTGNDTAVTVSTTLIPVLSIRPSATFNSLTNRGVFIPTGFDITADQQVRYVIFYKPTLTGASFGSVGSASAMDVDISATVVSGGIEIARGSLPTAGGSSRSRIDGILGKTILSLSRTGTSDILTLAMVRTGTSNAKVLTTVNWKEIR